MFTELFQPTLQFSVRFFGSCKSCMLCFIFSDFQPREMTFWHSKLSTPLHGESVGKALTGRCQGPDHPSDQCPPSWLYHSWHFRLVENVKHSRGCAFYWMSYDGNIEPCLSTKWGAELAKLVRANDCFRAPRQVAWRLITIHGSGNGGVQKSIHLVERPLHSLTQVCMKSDLFIRLLSVGHSGNTLCILVPLWQLPILPDALGFLRSDSIEWLLVAPEWALMTPTNHQPAKLAKCKMENLW